MRRPAFARIAVLFAAFFTAQALSACSRLVSVDPLAAGLPASHEQWGGAYTTTLKGDKGGGLPMLLRLMPRGDGAYDFTIHSRGPGKDIFAGSGALDLIGRGEVRLADLGEGYAVAQTRCEIAVSADASLPVERRTMADMMEIARRFGALSKNVPHSNYLGPFVYALVRGGPARPETIVGIDSLTAVTEAAQGTSVDVDKWEGGVGDGMLLGSGLVFESDDIHIANHGGTATIQPFFARLAKELFSAKEVGNLVSWDRVAPERLSALRYSNRFPPAGEIGGWCNLLAAMPKDK